MKGEQVIITCNVESLNYYFQYNYKKLDINEVKGAKLHFF